MRVGIEDAAFYVPGLYLSIEEFATARGIEPLKLKKGLGLQKMALPDVGEDAATMAANALIKLFEQNDLDPKHIGRVYLGTESALDAAKPTATYAVQMLEDYLSSKYGEDSCTHIDVVDMTFACIGAVDALQSTLDWVRAGSGRKGIVIASDFAKYELESTGEYTQGSGAVALLVGENPSLMSISEHTGVSTKSVHDFFKPRRLHHLSQVLQAQPLKKQLFPNSDWLEEFRHTPVFDGQFSNQCYQERMEEAYTRFKEQTGEDLDSWQHLVFHLPYAFHGRRIVTSMVVKMLAEKDEIAALEETIGVGRNDPAFIKGFSKSDFYRAFVSEKIAPGDAASSEIGNMYTASIFMSLMSTLYHVDSGSEGNQVGFIAYGSGSKSKVFSGTIEPGFKTKAAQWGFAEALEAREAISFEEYLKLHRSEIENPLRATASKYLLDSEPKESVLEGARFYKRQ